MPGLRMDQDFEIQRVLQLEEISRGLGERGIDGRCGS